MAVEIKIMKNPHIVSLLCLFLSIVVLCSCVPVPEIILYNNTNHVITIYADEEKYTMTAKTTKHIHWPGMSLKLVVTTENVIWVYKMCFVSDEYDYSNKIYAQLENNGFFYIGHKTDTFPLKVPISQPQGYPLIPMEDKGIHLKDISSPVGCQN